MQTFRIPVKDLTESELYQCIQEEAAELIKAVSKARRFGLWSNINKIAWAKVHAPARNNWTDVRDEYMDLYELINELAKRAEEEGIGLEIKPKERLVLRA